jgi:putative membrane protein
MRFVLKGFIISTGSLYIVSQLISGLVFAEGIYTLVLAGFVLMLANLIIKPVLNILLLPLNLITLGLFKWVTYAITFYLVTLVVPGFKITEFIFKAFNSYWFNIPGITLHGVFAFVAFAFLISLVSSVLHWIFK